MKKAHSKIKITQVAPPRPIPDELIEDCIYIDEEDSMLRILVNQEGRYDLFSWDGTGFAYVTEMSKGGAIERVRNSWSVYQRRIT